MRYIEKDGKKYKRDDDGTTYRISWSEELQLKQLDAQRKNAELLKINFYAKLALIVLLTLWFALFLFVLYRLDTVNFFTQLMYGG